MVTHAYWEGQRMTFDPEKQTIQIGQESQWYRSNGF